MVRGLENMSHDKRHWEEKRRHMIALFKYLKVQQKRSKQKAKPSVVLESIAVDLR